MVQDERERETNVRCTLASNLSLEAGVEPSQPARCLKSSGSEHMIKLGWKNE